MSEKLRLKDDRMLVKFELNETLNDFEVSLIEKEIEKISGVQEVKYFAEYPLPTIFIKCIPNVNVLSDIYKSLGSAMNRINNGRDYEG